jgi:outer membrane protein
LLPLLAPWLAFFAAAGCASDQAGDVDLYRRVSDPPGALPEYQPGGALSLEDALRFTTMYNERLAQQGERYIQALAERQRAAAALKPTFDLFSSTVLRENTGDGIAQTAIGVGGQYRLMTGQSNLRQVDASDARIRASQWLILDLRESLLLETARAYYQVLLAERLSEVLISSVSAQQARLEDARARNEVGFARPLDVAQSEAQVSRTRAQLIAARGREQEARATLTLLTSANVQSATLTDGFNAPADVPPREALLGLTHRHRQDLLAARAEADAARSEVDAAIGQYAPTLTVNLEAFLLREPDDSLGSITSLVQVRVPIFSAGRIEADIRAAWSRFREAALEYRLRARAATADVDVVLAQLQSSRARLDEFDTQTRVAREALTLADAAYEAGLGTNLERITAQDELLTAQLQRVSEEYQVKLLSLALRRACGTLAAEQIGAPLPETDERERTAPDAPLIERTLSQPTEGA